MTTFFFGSGWEKKQKWSLDTHISFYHLREIRIRDREMINVIDKWYNKKREIKINKNIRYILKTSECLNIIVREKKLTGENKKEEQGKHPNKGPNTKAKET